MAFVPDPTTGSVHHHFLTETCHRVCWSWNRACTSLPCKHTFTSDIDQVTEELDFHENPDKMQVIYDICYGTTPRSAVHLAPNEVNDFEERLKRCYRIRAKWLRLDAEAKARAAKRTQEAWERMEEGLGNS